ncbi:ester cyclase [Haloarcula pelagica]|nr:ester cyclase [Halomicroarcula sp. YJ-61-S]
MSTALQANKELVRRANDGLNAQDPEAFREHHAAELVLHDGGDVIHGVEAALQRERAIWAAFPDLHHTLTDLVAEGDTVAYRFTATGTHEGPFQGIEATGRPVDITGQGLVRVEDGVLAAVWLNYDRLGMLRQLGTVDRPVE